MPTEVLTVDECLRLLATQRIGRLAVVVDRYPMVVPVNYALDRGNVVFRTAPGVKLDAAQHRNVAFQVDQFDLSSRSGWSVLLTGTAEVLTDRHSAELVARTKALDIQPLESGPKPIWVRIIRNSVTGRRIGPEGLLEVHWGSEAYL
jgi:uncharacterized protein